MTQAVDTLSHFFRLSWRTLHYVSKAVHFFTDHPKAKTIELWLRPDPDAWF